MGRSDDQLSLRFLETVDPVSPSRSLRGSRKATLPRLSVGPDEAAEMLGVSRDYLDEHILRELRVVRRGRRVLIALRELERWLDRSATRGRIGGRA